MNRLREMAEKYATQLCGTEGLKDQPILNRHLPEFMCDAFIAGFKACAEMAAEIAQKRVRCQSNPDMCREAEIIARLIRALVDEAGGE